MPVRDEGPGPARAGRGLPGSSAPSRRNSMPDTDLRQPYPGPLRAAAEAAELAQAVSGLVSSDGCRLADSDPLAPLARDIARSMTEAGLTVHHCARHDPLYRLGGVCLLAVPAESGAGYGGVSPAFAPPNSPPPAPGPAAAATPSPASPPTTLPTRRGARSRS